MGEQVLTLTNGLVIISFTEDNCEQCLITPKSFVKSEVAAGITGILTFIQLCKLRLKYAKDIAGVTTIPVLECDEGPSSKSPTGLAPTKATSGEVKELEQRIAHITEELSALQVQGSRRRLHNLQRRFERESKKA